MISYWVIDETGNRLCIVSIRTAKEYDRLYHMCKGMLVPVGDWLVTILPCSELRQYINSVEMYRIKHNLALPASGLYGVLDDNNCIGGLRIIPMLLSGTSLLGKATVDLISMVENHNKFNPFSLVDLQQIQDQLADMTLLIAETFLVIEKRKLEMV